MPQQMELEFKETIKKCAECGIEKSTTEFYLSRRKKPVGRCKVCCRKRHRELWHKNRDFMHQYHRRYRKEHPEKRWDKVHPDRARNLQQRCGRKYRLKFEFGITLEEYDRMFKLQEGKCYLCHIPQSSLKNRLCIDHDHTTGKIRHLLCHKCNRGLGVVEIIGVDKIVSYLGETYL